MTNKYHEKEIKVGSSKANFMNDIPRNKAQNYIRYTVNRSQQVILNEVNFKELYYYYKK